MKFGLICEGATDFHVLKHITQAYFSEATILDIQPRLDARQIKTGIDEFGGWEQVSSFLQTDQFEVTVENTDFVIIQIDTDVCEHPNFNASSIALADSDHDIFYEQITSKLIELMDKYELGTYEYYKHKILFAISVHSLECWLLAYHGNKGYKVTGCFEELGTTLRRKGEKFNNKNKDAHEYIRISKDLKKQKNHNVVIKKSKSFQIFVEQLQKISTCIEDAE